MERRRGLFSVKFVFKPDDLATALKRGYDMKEVVDNYKILPDGTIVFTVRRWDGDGAYLAYSDACYDALAANGGTE